MTNNFKKMILPFIQLMASVFILFFLTVGMGKAAADLIIYMNDKNISKPFSEWLIFIIGTPIATGFWCVIWLWFKASEKACLDLLSKK